MSKYWAIISWSMVSFVLPKERVEYDLVGGGHYILSTYRLCSHRTAAEGLEYARAAFS